MYFKENITVAIKLKNLFVPKDIALRATIDLALNGFENTPKTISKPTFCVNMDRHSTNISLKGTAEAGFILSPPSDWAKVGINRAIINDNAQMQTLFQLLKSTITQTMRHRSIHLSNGWNARCLGQVADEIEPWWTK